MAAAAGRGEDKELVRNIERSAARFDHSGRAELSDREWFNVIKLQNGVECTRQDIINLYLLVTSPL